MAVLYRQEVRSLMHRHVEKSFHKLPAPTKKEHAREILRRLRKHYTKTPDAFVRWKNSLELVVGTVLSAQCTDKKVNEVTRTLFKKYKTAHDYAAARLPTLEKEIHATGFYKSKARYLKGIGELLVHQFRGEVPQMLEELLTLPGVAYKSAYLILAKAFHKSEGIAVDTHVARIAPRLGLSKNTAPEKIGKDVERFFPPKDYLDVNEYFILHGRALCTAKPKCSACPLKDLCPYGTKLLRASYS